MGNNFCLIISVALPENTTTLKTKVGKTVLKSTCAHIFLDHSMIYKIYSFYVIALFLATLKTRIHY